MSAHPEKSADAEKVPKEQLIRDFDFSEQVMTFFMSLSFIFMFNDPILSCGNFFVLLSLCFNSKAFFTDSFNLVHLGLGLIAIFLRLLFAYTGFLPIDKCKE